MMPDNIEDIDGCPYSQLADIVEFHANGSDYDEELQEAADRLRHVEDHLLSLMEEVQSKKEELDVARTALTRIRQNYDNIGKQGHSAFLNWLNEELASYEHTESTYDER